jgi:hypothetical protein
VLGQKYFFGYVRSAVDHSKLQETQKELNIYKEEFVELPGRWYFDDLIGSDMKLWKSNPWPYLSKQVPRF